MATNSTKTKGDKPKTSKVWYVIISAVLLGLLLFGLYGVQQFQTGRFAWMAHDETRFFNKIKKALSPVQLPREEDAVLQRMVPIHDGESSRFKQFESELEQDCYLAFAGSVCGFSRESSRVKYKVEAFINQEGKPDASEQVQACAKGSQRFRDEMKALKSGRPHCETVKDIVLSIREKK